MACLGVGRALAAIFAVGLRKGRSASGMDMGSAEGVARTAGAGRGTSLSVPILPHLAVGAIFAFGRG